MAKHISALYESFCCDFRALAHLCPVSLGVCFGLTFTGLQLQEAYINTSVSLAFVLLTALKALRFSLGWNQLDRSVSFLFLNSSNPVVLQGDTLVRFQKISIFHQTLRKVLQNMAASEKWSNGAKTESWSSGPSWFLLYSVFLFCLRFALCLCFCFKLLSYLRFLFFICLFLFFDLRLNPTGHHTIVIRSSVVLPQGVNKFILRVTVSTNKMDVLANSVLHQIVWTIADIKMHADSTLSALKLAVLLFTGTHQLWNFVTAYSVFPKKIPSIVVFDLNCGIWEGQGAWMPLMYQVRDVTLPLVNLIRWSNVLPLT